MVGHGRAWHSMVGHGSGHWGGSLGTGFIGAVSLGSERAAPVRGCMGAGLVSFYHDQ